MQVAKQLYERIASQIEQSTSTIEISCTSHNYCDNESISIVFALLNCAHFAVQFWLYRWKLYMIVTIVDWCASCETTVQTLALKMCFDDWTKKIWWFFSLETWIKYWLNLSTLKNETFVLIRNFFDRSFAFKRIYWIFFYRMCFIVLKFERLCCCQICANVSSLKTQFFAMFAMFQYDCNHNSMRSRSIFEVVDYLNSVHFVLQNEFSIVCFTYWMQMLLRCEIDEIATQLLNHSILFRDFIKYNSNFEILHEIFLKKFTSKLVVNWENWCFNHFFKYI